MSLTSVTVLSAISAAIAWCSGTADDGKSGRRRHEVFARYPVQTERSLEPEDPLERILQAFLADHAAAHALEHEAEIFIRVAHEEEHVAARGDDRRHEVAAWECLT